MQSIENRSAEQLRRLIDRSCTLDQIEAGGAAFRRYGRGHPAGLNLGDVFADALARTAGEPLLFEGDDFARTDIASAA